MQILSPTANSTVPTPVRFVASEDGAAGWVVAQTDGTPLYKTTASSLDAWVLLPKTPQSVIVSALGGDGNPIASEPLQFDVTSVAVPAPPDGAQSYEVDTAHWTVETTDIGGCFQWGQLLSFANPPSPPPNGSTEGFCFRVVSQSMTEGPTDGLCQWHTKVATAPLNALWTFLFNVPADQKDVIAYEADFNLVAEIDGAARWFNFSGQYARTPQPRQWQWESWASGGWNAVPGLGTGPAISNNAWHRLTMFYQRVTPGGYQSAGGTDTNENLLYGVARLDDDDAMLWNVPTESLATSWAPQVKLQHQIDVPAGGALVDKWVTGQVLTTW